MDSLTQQLLLLMAFIALLLLINLKSGSRHWTGSLLKVSSFWLMVAAIGLLVWKLGKAVL